MNQQSSQDVYIPVMFKDEYEVFHCCQDNEISDVLHLLNAPISHGEVE